MISHELKCIYIHIPKTAGTSVESCFGEHKSMDERLKQDHRTLINIKHSVPPWQLGSLSPVKYIKYINQRRKAKRDHVQVLNAQQFETYFKFAFVRNPWDRVFSWYRNVMRDPLHQEELNVKPDLPFNVFMQEHLSQWALRPQTDWLFDENNKIGVDFVGRFENLNEDFQHIASMLKLGDIELPNFLDSGKPEYRDAYDNKTKDVIYQKYKKEIELFNYDF